MHIIPTSKNFEVYFDYNKNINAALKQMKGQYRAAYGSKDNHWIVPLAYEDALMKLLGKYQKPNSVAGLPQVTGVIPPMPELEIDIPLLRPLYHYQQQGTAQMLKFKRCINGDQPGLGKSQEAIAACVGAGSKCILVICPSSLRINWQKEFMMVAGMKSIILTDAIKKTWHCYHETGTCKVFITNYESLEKYFVQEINRDPKKKTFRQEDIIFKSRIYDFDTVIIDEIHRCKDPTTQVSKFVYGVCDKKEYIFGLSGTPVVNKTKDLISLLTIIRKMGNMTGQKTIQEASKWFLNRYCGGEAANQNTNSAELQYKLLTTCYFQREKKDVLKDLPDLSRQIIKCEITNQKEYDFALRNLETYLKEFKNKTDEETKKSMNGEIMVRIQVLKQIAARGKIEAASEIVDEIIDAGRKIVKSWINN